MEDQGLEVGSLGQLHTWTIPAVSLLILEANLGQDNSRASKAELLKADTKFQF